MKFRIFVNISLSQRHSTCANLISLNFWGKNPHLSQFKMMWDDTSEWYNFAPTQKAKTLGSKSIRYRPNTFVSHRYLIDIDPSFFAIWEPNMARLPVIDSMWLWWNFISGSLKCPIQLLPNVSAQVSSNCSIQGWDGSSMLYKMTGVKLTPLLTPLATFYSHLTPLPTQYALIKVLSVNKVLLQRASIKAIFF